MIKYKLIIAYEGTGYCGWQTQKNGISIQATIEKVLSKIFQEPIVILGAGRTDAGVHAIGQVAHFTAIKKKLPQLLQSINGLLPQEIRILQIKETPPCFHARYSAIGKEYHYHIHTDTDPFISDYSYHCKSPLNIEKLQEGARRFVGTHDFSSFANGPPATLVKKNLVRTIYKLDVYQHEKKIRLEFEGNGFLHKMVRNITSTLLEVGKGKLSCGDITSIFKAKNRSKTPNPAPPQGLFLIEVFYPSDLII